MSSGLKLFTLFGLMALLNGKVLDANNVKDEEAVVAGVKNPRSLGLSKISGDKEYFIGNFFKLNWFQAVQMCALNDMSLTAIETEDEQNDLKKLLEDNSLLDMEYWLSGTNLADRSQYMWMNTGKAVTYVKWEDGEAPRAASNRCIRTTNKLDWTAEDCGQVKSYFICSRPLEPACGAQGKCVYTIRPYF
uniref:C-type lectin domain-containing protein n=1 Tax=Stomoxys calcitrans TaxID=35570 RepID=A0A1I8NQD5_STOCA